MVGKSIGVRGSMMNLPAYVLLLIGAGFTAGFLGCSLGGEPDKAPQAAGETPAPAPSSEKSAPEAAKETTLESQAFRLQTFTVREESGQTTFHLKFSRPVSQYRHFPLTQPSRVVLDVFGETQRLAQGETFRIDTGWVGTARLSSGKGYLRLVAEIAAAAVPPYVVTPEDGGLKVVIGAVNARATAKKELELVRGGKRVDVQVTGAPSPGEPAVQPSSAETAMGGKKQYTGQRISLDFKDADIKNVFRLLAEVSGLNIVVTNDVNRKVTVRLVDVPWDQALDLLIETNGLGKEEVGNVVRISTAGQLKAEKDALAAAKKAKEDLEPLQTSYFNINYAKVKDLEPKVKELLTKRGKLVTDERSNTIMVRDIQQSVEDVNTLVSRLDTRTPQIQIESNLIETTPTFARALGTQLQFDFGNSTAVVDATTGNVTGRRARIITDFPAGTPASSASPFFSVLQGRVGAFRNVAAVLTAAEKEGNIKIISRPSVVTLNNVLSTIQSLRILRVTLPTSTNIASGTGAAAGAAVATEKINVGIILSVTPQVSADGFVLMNINVKSSSIADSPTVSGSGSSVLPFDELSREANANVLVRDGETIVIGGIMKDTRATTEGGIPYLKDIPVLGWLFKNIRWQKDMEELMVFITPRIVSAGSVNLPSAEQLWREQLKKTEGKQTTSPLPNP